LTVITIKWDKGNNRTQTSVGLKKCYSQHPLWELGMLPKDVPRAKVTSYPNQGFQEAFRLLPLTILKKQLVFYVICPVSLLNQLKFNGGYPISQGPNKPKHHHHQQQQ